MTTKKQSLLREASHQIIAGGSAGKTPLNSLLFHTIRNFVYQLVQSRARLVHIHHQLG